MTPTVCAVLAWSFQLTTGDGNHRPVTTSELHDLFRNGELARVKRETGVDMTPTLPDNCGDIMFEINGRTWLLRLTANGPKLKRVQRAAR